MTKKKTPGQSTEPTLSQLQWMEGWLKSLSKPGPKLEARYKVGDHTVSKMVPYPEQGRQQAIAQLAKVQAKIAELEAITCKD